MKLENGDLKEFKPIELEPVERTSSEQGISVGTKVTIGATSEHGVVEKISEKDGKHTVSVKLASGKVKDFTPKELEFDDHSSVIGLKVHTKSGTRGTIEKTTESREGRFATIKTSSGNMEDFNMEELMIGNILHVYAL